MKRRFAHMITSRNGRDIKTKCGRDMKLGSREEFRDRFTVWHHLMTCPRCVRVYEAFHDQER